MLRLLYSYFLLYIDRYLCLVLYTIHRLMSMFIFILIIVQKISITLSSETIQAKRKTSTISDRCPTINFHQNNFKFITFCCPYNIGIIDSVALLSCTYFLNPLETALHVQPSLDFRRSFPY